MAQIKIRWAILVALFILELLTSITEGKKTVIHYVYPSCYKTNMAYQILQINEASKQIIQKWIAIVEMIFLLTRRAFVHQIVKHPNLILKPHVLLLQLTTILLHIIVMPINAKNLVYYKRLSILVPFFRHCNRWVIHRIQMKT